MLERDLKFEVINFLINGKKIIRSDGKINSPLSKKFIDTELYSRIVEKTNFLPMEAKLAQRWWHISNNMLKYKRCVCGKDITVWRKKYCNYCSHICATTCDEARDRARLQTTGRKMSKEHCDKMSKARVGFKHSQKTKELLSYSKIGEKNHRFGKDPWNKGLFGVNNPNFGKKRPYAKMPTGVNNKQYGKSPVHSAGHGVWGSFNGVFFRSSLELFYLIYWYENRIEVESAEQEMFRMIYLSNGKKHTYTPDFYLCDLDTIVEIKPEFKQQDCLVQIKYYTLKYYFEYKKCLLLGYRDIGGFITELISSNRITFYIASYSLIINDKQLQRLKRNYGCILREVRKVS